MRLVYALIAVFLLLCVFFAQWYLCNVRLLCEQKALFEILAMLLIAFIIGFAGSWLLSENIFQSVRGQVGGLMKEKSTMREQIHLLEKENRAIHQQLMRWQQEASLLAQLKKSTEPLLIEANNQVHLLKEELEAYERRYENLKREVDSIRETASQLKNELNEERARSTEREPVKELTAEEKKQVRDAKRSRFTPSTWQTKDDFTLISGIGPAIQKKLNALGIFTFEQLSQLTPEQVELVTKAIKFFPDRIGRDNWIGQAAAFMRHKK